MRIEDIVAGLNKHIDTKREERGIKHNSRLILHRQINSTPNFPAYKEFNARVWFCYKGQSHTVFMIKLTEKVLAGQEDKLWTSMTTTLLDEIFNWIGSEGYNRVIEGTYEG